MAVLKKDKIGTYWAELESNKVSCLHRIANLADSVVVTKPRITAFLLGIYQSWL